MDKENIGWIGLGNMGKPMVENLLKSGINVTIYNRSKEKCLAVAGSGVVVAESIADLVAKSSIIFSMVSNDKAVTDIYEEVLKSDNLSDKLFVDMSTISTNLSVSTASSLKVLGASFIDAPVLGSTKPAEEGNLVIVAGGDHKDLERAMPYLRKLGKAIKHLGKNGKGSAAKIAVNYFVSILYQGLAETVLLAENNGISRVDILDLINESASGSGATKVKTDPLVNEDYSPAFTIDLMLKDVLLAKNSGANYPLTNSLVESYSNASKNGLGALDVIGVIKYLEDLN